MHLKRYIKRDKGVKARFKSCALCILLNLSIVPSSFAIDVITNSKGSNLLVQKQSNLRAIFSMHTRYWPNGKKIKVFVLPDDNILHQAFVKERLQMFPYQLRRTWNRKTYTGTGQPPITVDSVSEMLEKIRQTEYSIGYIDRRVSDEHISILDIQ